MSAPQIVSVQPDVGVTDVVLSLPITVTFDQVIDTTTITSSTFSLSFQATSQVITNRQLLDGDAQPSTVPVDGAWTFSTNGSNQTVAVFTPTRPLKPNTLYTVNLLGSDAALTSEVLKNLAGEAMAVSYQWTFTTGALNLKTRPGLFVLPEPKSLARTRGQDSPTVGPPASGFSLAADTLPEVFPASAWFFRKLSPCRYY